MLMSLFRVLNKVVLSDWNSDGSKFIGLGTDGCNTMVGKNHSLMTLCKGKFPNLTHIKCGAHSLDLCAKDAMKVMPSNIEFLIRESYNFFCHSPIRQYEYQKVLELVGFDDIVIEEVGENDVEDDANNDDLDNDQDNAQGDDDQASSSNNQKKRKPLKLISLATTRWLVLGDCNERILKQVNDYFINVSFEHKI